MQCDSLLAEVEHKRSLFLADLDQEERMRHSEIENVIEVFEKILGASQSLAHYTKDVLEKDTVTTVLQVVCVCVCVCVCMCVGVCVHISSLSAD